MGRSQLSNTSVKASWNTWPTWTKPQTPQSGRTPLVLTSLAPMTFFSTIGCRAEMPRYSCDPSEPSFCLCLLPFYFCLGGPKGRKGPKFPAHDQCLGGDEEPLHPTRVNLSLKLGLEYWSL